MTDSDRQELFANPADPGNGALPFRAGYRQMVAEYFVSRAREAARERRARLNALATRTEAEQYRDRVRARIRGIFGPAPEKTPLNAVVTGVLERPGLRIEKLHFESRPGVLVTANLYLPVGKGPFPGVIGTCGHSATGKAAAPYQSFARRLAAAGFATLVYDPFSQGERDQYPDLPADEPVRRACTTAHNMMGKQLELCGEFFGAWRAWDGIRALDYLAGRPEIDASRLAVTGNSGGGTMSTWLWPLDERFRAAAPSCFVTTFRANLENQLPADSEQCPPGVIGAGLDMGDFFLARAPEPVILLGQHYDFFDERGLRETWAETRRFYGLFGAADRVRLFVGPRPHGYGEENQQAMVTFFCQCFNQPLPENDPPAVVETPEALNATPQGQVIAAGARPIQQLNADRAAALTTGRPAPDPEALREAIARVLTLPARRGAPGYRILRRFSEQATGRLLCRYAVETETGIQAILLRQVSERPAGMALEADPAAELYLPHLSAEMEMNNPGFPAFTAASDRVFALDPRGLGASLPDEDGAFFAPYGHDYMFHAWSLMLGESYLGRRLHDVLATLDLLAEKGARTINLHGHGQGALLAVLAGVMHPLAGRVRTKHLPPSWLEMTRTPLVPWPAACCPRGVLAAFDLPDCLGCLGGRLNQT